MSSVDKSFGTQSPPLGASSDDKPMGVSNIRGDKPAAVSDKQQRQGYFDNQKGSIGDNSPTEVHAEKAEKIKKD
ncbi:hypothetical protein K466DRAFT_659327 [Polyporus arcularius HHB13444]|uniref:Uncharacterized protein n=1 Tax=Polyporus arcularius HHB13444 TaxID=1314778 RepID=A0A5C3PUJ5_9APHY|nr:hypothetical protein K466DRAFT_659327 [Polyporus arcularius HHB13444]